MRGFAVLSYSTNTDLPVTFKTVSQFRQDRAARRNPDTQASCLPNFNLESSDCSAALLTAQAVNDGAIQHALEFFDAQAVSVPSSFVSATTAVQGPSALSEFMSRAVDFESAFQFADAGIPQQNKAETVGASPLQTELSEDDGFCTPMSAADCHESHELPMPDEPSLASFRMLDQAAVLKDPQEASSITSAIEKDEAGRVVKAMYCGGESVRFQYDEDGQLIEFNYAGMSWIREENGWSAQDRQTEYFVEGKISVLPTGAIKIEREDVVRTLKLSGTRIDEHKSGSRTESRKLKNKPSPYDLLAKAKAASSIWLNAKSVYKHSGEQVVHAPLCLDLVSEPHKQLPQNTQSLIPDIAKVPEFNPGALNPGNLTCVPTAPIELRSLEGTEKLRSLEDELLEPQRERHSKSNVRHQTAEYWLKCNLWVTDRLFGQSSPKHLEQLDRLAQLYFEQQKNDLSELTHLRALHIREQFYGKGQPELAHNIRGLAQIYEARGNYARAEEMYKESIELQESGLRKTLFLFSEKVIDNSKLNEKLDGLFASIADLSRLYSLQGKQKLCTVVYEKALALAAEISEREPNAEQSLDSSAATHLQTMEQLSISDLLT